jgi:hypothetical protein
LAAAPPDPAELDADSLAAAACDATGLQDFGSDGWREGVERLLDALREEARLSDLGRMIAAGEVLTYLSNRLGIVDWGRRDPTMLARAIRQPVFIVGQARTGTTILHDLLAQDPANRVPLSWEVDRPCPPPRTESFENDPRIAEVQALIDASEQILPGFKALHPIGARLAQECVRITASDFRSLIFPTQYRVPSYATWLLDRADLTTAYRWHRRFLQHLQAQHRAERWVLKSPGHQWHLGALLAEYPDALLVQTHRDPLHIVASLGSLISTLRRLGSDVTSNPEAAAEFAEYVLDGLNRSVRARNDGTVPRSKVVDVHFGEFMSDPMATVRRIYAQLGLELGQAAERRMRAFLADNPRDKHGRHRYMFAETGLDAGALRERARPYQQYFDVPSEPLP